MILERKGGQWAGAVGVWDLGWALEAAAARGETLKRGLVITIDCTRVSRKFTLCLSFLICTMKCLDIALASL